MRLIALTLVLAACACKKPPPPAPPASDGPAPIALTRRKCRGADLVDAN